MTDPTTTPAAPERPWLDTALSPRERAQALVAAMTPEQKIAQLHGAMETIDIYALSNSAASAEEMDQLAAQIRIERHVEGIEELGIPRFRITNGPWGSSCRATSSSSRWPGSRRACACTGCRSAAATSSTSPRTRT